MTEEELEKKAKNYAEEQEKNCTLGVYDNTDDLEYDIGYNTGYVIGLEEGYIAGAKELQKQKTSCYVLNLLEETSFYDEADCDGYCLFDDIENFLNS